MRWLAAAGAVALTACASHPQFVRVGESAEAVRARLGAPYDAVKRPDGERLIYPVGAFAQQSYLIEVGSDGLVRAVIPALTDERFAMIKMGEWDRRRVLEEFGPPAETGVVPLKKQEVWSYRYKRDGVWDSLMHVHFDMRGVVANLFHTPDPFFDSEDRNFSGLLRLP
ncbi:MAG TPA: hypothetical protein VFR86_08535 [Burkholderiaceae bacterium]|nr:hypothetical protein [Burkholderiaceae bacterium]